MRSRRDIAYPRAGPPPKCHGQRCERSLPASVPRVQIEGLWWCPDCALERERGEDLARLPKRNSRRKNENQLDLLQLHGCTTCHSTGLVYDRTGEKVRCPTCQGAGTLDFDPNDKSGIPF